MLSDTDLSLIAQYYDKIPVSHVLSASHLGPFINDTYTTLKDDVRT